MNAQHFIDVYKVSIAIEPTSRNPMGPDIWQPLFKHYALWLRTKNGQCALYVSTPGPILPDSLLLEKLGQVVGSVLRCTSFEDWCAENHMTADEHTRFYYDAIQRKIPDLSRTLGENGLNDLIQLN